MKMKWITFTALSLVIASSGMLACKKKSASSSSGSGVVTEANANLKTIYFDFDKYNVRSDATSTLQQNASWLKENSNKNVIIEGHTDERGTNEYNMALGERRAKAAKDYLSNLGISSSRIETVSYGEEKPAEAGHDEAAWAKNRRAETVIRK